MSDISFVVCTRNRAAALPPTLDALSATIAEAPNLSVEVVLVDNGSTDGTVTVIDRWARSAPFLVTRAHEARPGLAAARNCGVRVARGPILVFTDDDCRPAPGYLADLMRHFAKDTQPTIRGGRVELGDPADLPFTIKLDPEPARLEAGTHPGGFVLGCNMAMHREVLDILGPFDERFGAGAPFIAAEETDLLHRAYLRGIPVHYAPDMVIRHYHGRRDIRDIRQLNFGYHVGSGALYMKYMRNPSLLRHFYWDFRKALRELIGGPLFDAKLGLSHRSSVLGNLKGMAIYLSGVGWRRPHASEHSTAAPTPNTASST